MTYMQGLFGLFCALQIADVHSTWRALGPGRTEVNPLVRRLLAKTGYGGLVVFKLALCLLIWWLLPGVHWAALAGLCLLFTAIVINNYRLVR